MKPMRYISLIIALLSVLGLAAQQQQSQYALYNYRNDGDFNAWLNIDVDSITYSNIGLDSVEYDNIVTQEVWTPDSCYRIPIEVIDSIGFRAPAPEFKDGIFLITEEHLPYIIAVDDESVTFSNDTPSLLMPYTGQIMYSDLTTEPFYMGFAGRIVELQTTEEGITYRCEPVSPSEVYNRYLNVFKVVTDPDNVLDPYTRPRHAPKRSIFGGIAEDGLITIPDIKIKFDTSLNKWAGCSGNVTIDAKISNSVEYVICVGMLDADFVNIKHTKKVNWSLGTSYKIEKFDDKEDSYEEWLDTPFFTWGCPWLGLNLYCGLFFDVKANLELIAKFPVYESTSVEEYYFGTDVGWTNPIVTQFNSGGWSSTRDEQIDALVDDTEVKVKLSGSISFGPVIKASFQVWKPNWLSFDVRAKGGLELSGECAMDLWALVHGEDVIYKTISEDTKITSGLKIALELHGTAMKKDCTFASVSRTLFKTEHYLFPRFTQPAFPKYINGTWEGGVSPLSVYTVPSNNLLLPGKVGLSVYDELGNKISTSYGSIWFFGGDWEKSWLQSDVSNLECGKTYIVRPFFRMLNINEVLASPSSQFTVPEPMTLDINTPLNSVTLGKGQEGFYAINGGWGEFSVHSSMKAICDAEIVMNNDKPYVKISASNRMTGPATVTVKDLRAGTTETILVTVSSDAVPELTVSEQAVTLQESESITVLVTSGSGNYTVESSDENIATATIEGNEIIITAISIGPASVIITDTETKQEVVIEVSVTEAGGNDNTHGEAGQAEYDAAMAAITNGSYYISTKVGGTKYYLTTEGRLTNVIENGGLFTISKASGGELYDVGINIDPGTGYHFTNTTLVNEKANLHPGTGAFYMTNNFNRNNWERQVLFLNETGKFAIRTSNTAYGTESWEDAGRTFWTYEVDETGAPVLDNYGLMACYSYEPTYIWEINKTENLDILPSTILSPEIQWSADIMVFNDSERYGTSADGQVIDTPPSDASGNEWYAPNYKLTNGQKSWNVGYSPFLSETTTTEINTVNWTTWSNSTCWSADKDVADIYMRRTFTVDHALSDRILLSCCHDDAAEWYLNGVLIHSETGYNWNYNYNNSIYLTPEQRALIHTDGRKNVLSVHVHNYGGPALADEGLYEVREVRSAGGGGGNSSQ